MQGNALVPLVMYLWIPVVLYIFTRFPPQRALIVSMIAAWLFLPLAEIKFPGIPVYNKMAATCYGVLLANIIYDFGRISSFQFGWLDLPMLIWCLCPFASSLTNDLGAYDGFSTTFSQVVTWGVPYFLGRIYLNNLAGLRQLAVGIFLGGLIYVPFCLYEVRFSRNIHGMVYGFQSAATGFLISIRMGGYRPAVFMVSGLELGVWIMAATLLGIVLWRAGIIKRVRNIPMSWLVIVLLVTFVLVKATGAYALLGLGLIIFFTAKWFRTALGLWILVIVISSYLHMGVNGTFTGQQREQIVTFANNTAGPDRAQSLDFRFQNEEILGNKARQNPIFGWGGFGRNRVYDQNGKDISITDSLWIIVFGINGVVGLCSMTASLLLPAVSFCFRYPASTWSNPKVAPAAALAVCLVLYMLDCLSNAFVNPIYTLAAGGISGLLLKETEPLNVTHSYPARQKQPRPN